MKLCALTSMVAVVLSENCPVHGFQVRGYEVVQSLYVFVCFDSVKQRSSEGLEAARMELEEREKVREELHGVQVWLEAADGVLSEMEQSCSTGELQVSPNENAFIITSQQTSNAFLFLVEQCLLRCFHFGGSVYIFINVYTHYCCCITSQGHTEQY